MKSRWIGIVTVAIIAIAIIAYKSHRSHESGNIAAPPRVLLVADLREADSPGDSCAEIIRSVRAARARGIVVEELDPDSKSDLLSRYHVLAIPTVLVLDNKGDVVSRYEGEGQQTVAAVRSELEQLQ